MVELHKHHLWEPWNRRSVAIFNDKRVPDNPCDEDASFRSMRTLKSAAPSFVSTIEQCLQVCGAQLFGCQPASVIVMDLVVLNRQVGAPDADGKNSEPLNAQLRHCDLSPNSKQQRRDSCTAIMILEETDKLNIFGESTDVSPWVRFCYLATTLPCYPATLLP